MNAHCLAAAILSAVLSAGAESTVSPAPTNAPPAAGQKETATYEGRLKTGVVAIGGETTGIVLTTGAGGKYELDLGGDKALGAQARKLDGKDVVVEGCYRPRPGVEIGLRRIILVRSIRARPAPP